VGPGAKIDASSGCAMCSRQRAGGRHRVASTAAIEAATGTICWATLTLRARPTRVSCSSVLCCGRMRFPRSITGRDRVPASLPAEIRQAQLKGPDQLDRGDRSGTFGRIGIPRRFHACETPRISTRLLEESHRLRPDNSDGVADLAFAAAFRGGVRLGRRPGRVACAARESHVRVAADDSAAMAHTALAYFDLFPPAHEEGPASAARGRSISHPNSNSPAAHLGGSMPFGRAAIRMRVGNLGEASA